MAATPDSYYDGEAVQSAESTSFLRQILVVSGGILGIAIGADAALTILLGGEEFMPMTTMAVEQTVDLVT